MKFKALTIRFSWHPNTNVLGKLSALQQSMFLHSEHNKQSFENLHAKLEKSLCVDGCFDPENWMMGLRQTKLTQFCWTNIYLSKVFYRSGMAWRTAARGGFEKAFRSPCHLLLSNHHLLKQCDSIQCLCSHFSTTPPPRSFTILVGFFPTSFNFLKKTNSEAPIGFRKYNLEL